MPILMAETSTAVNVDPVELAAISWSASQPTQRQIRISDLERAKDEPEPPSSAISVLQKWNSPRINMWKVFTCFWSLFVMGMNDGAYGVSCGNLFWSLTLLT
jgi:hypothetical protein